MRARVRLRIHVNRRADLVCLLTLACLTTALVGVLAWRRPEVSAAALPGPLASPAYVRQYYLTHTSHAGGAAAGDNGDGAGVCTPGYHFASLWEILDPSGLRYNTALGIRRADSGHGPPSGVPMVGWVRTGNFSSVAPDPGEANCDAWTSSSPGDYGTVVALPANWSAPQDIYVWNAQANTCDNTFRIWCVQDYGPRIYLPLLVRN